MKTSISQRPDRFDQLTKEKKLKKLFKKNNFDKSNQIFFEVCNKLLLTPLIHALQNIKVQRLYIPTETSGV